VFLAKRGVGSRRHCETLIRQGRVEVNGTTVREMGVQVDSIRDTVLVDHHRISGEEELVAIAFHKPAGVVSTRRVSREGAPAITDLVELPYRLYPAGRLDKDSTGLIILTNDGDLALRITHPRYEKEKEYLVMVQKPLTSLDLELLRQGVALEDGVVVPVSVVLHRDGSVTIIVAEGRKRLIRRMIKAIGNRVRTLHRIRIGSVRLGDLQPGRWRKLSEQEIQSFRDLTKQ
jgi:23S rRNA pseudouridine2605 synthase